MMQTSARVMQCIGRLVGSKLSILDLFALRMTHFWSNLVAPGDILRFDPRRDGAEDGIKHSGLLAVVAALWVERLSIPTRSSSSQLKRTSAETMMQVVILQGEVSCGGLQLKHRNTTLDIQAKSKRIENWCELWRAVPVSAIEAKMRV